MNDNFEWIPAQWPAPDTIHAGSTIRNGVGRKNNHADLNFSEYIDDEGVCVNRNRQLLMESLQLPSEPVWLNQTHSNRIADLDNGRPNLNADGASCTMKNTVCCVVTADCLPLLLYDSCDNRIAAIHIGWKGFCAGIIENAIELFSQTVGIIAWIGPGISAERYEVGPDVYSACTDYFPEAAAALRPSRKEHWLADLKEMVKMKLNKFDVAQIADSGLCTYSDRKRFYSYRRDGATGRMATIIWME